MLTKLFTFIAIASSLHAGAVLAAPSSREISAIIKRGKLVVAMVAEDQPPFIISRRNGDLTGLDPDLARDIAKELGVEVVFNRNAKTFNETVDLVINGEADIVISKLSCTLSRAKKVLFTQPYIVLRKALLLNRLSAERARGKQPLVDMVKNLKGNVGVIKGSSYVGYGKRMFPEATIVEYESWEEVTQAVRDGQALAAFRDELEVKKVMHLDPKARITLQSVVFKDTRDPLGIAVPVEAPHLLSWLNLYLSYKTGELTVDSLLEEYKENLLLPQSQP